MCLVGFDGFTDHILSVVAHREDCSHFAPMKKMRELSRLIDDSSGVSCNVELVVKQKKVGGNAPILAGALAGAGHSVSLIAAIGEPAIEQPFQELARSCTKVYSLASSAHTDALEFEDGKILLGKHESILSIGYDTLIEKVSKKTLISLLDEAKLFASVNWTMLPLMNQIWEGLQQEILPQLSQKERFVFIDLADPRKRSVSDLQHALSLLARWGPSHRVILSLNASEHACVQNALQKKEIFSPLNLHSLLIHHQRGATLTTKEGSWTSASAPCNHPVIQTGAGDHFNAGFCSALLQNLAPEDSLQLAIQTARFYLQKGKSPSQEELHKWSRTQ